MKYAVEVEVVVEANDEDDAWDKTYALMQKQLGEGSSELPEGVSSWAMYEEVVTPLDEEEQ